MPRKSTEAKLTALRSQLERHAPTLEAGERETLMEQLADLERQLAAAMPHDIQELEDRLLAWELNVVTRHPLLAGILRETMQRLAAMGI